jgi:preprotein translocase subunit SecA
MEVLERIWEFVGGFFSGMARGLERGLTSVFGSSNARYLRRLHPKVDAINAREAALQQVTDAELREETEKFRRRLAAGETLDDILIDAFAVSREAGRRVLGMRHFDVQLMGGMVLHSGAIAEMVTGEGKTLVATLPGYLNALEGRGVHVVTVNDYLARRDMEWMGPLYMSLGLTVGNIQNSMGTLERQKSYACDITYGTNNEFGFDYLRDNMRPAARGDDRYGKENEQVQGPLHYAIIDEVDNILIDEARTPLIISGPAHDDVNRYRMADRIARMLKRDAHFEVNEKDHSCNLTDDGVRKAEEFAGVESFYTAGNMEWPHLIDNSLKAHHLYKRDVNYIVTQEGEVVIVDEFTGRLMPGRNWSDGLHQAVEAKEGVRVKEENQTLATITLQNYFKLYKKICGMTGTAMTEANEFWKIYHLDVIAIPTNCLLTRGNHPDVIYRSAREKYIAIVDEIERMHKWDVLHVDRHESLVGTIVRETDEGVEFQPQGEKTKQSVPRARLRQIERQGRPVLVGTVSIERSEMLSSLLDRRGVKHQVLNAKHHQREAEIIAQAGRKSAVTIATNMAGRGTDIVLGGNPESMAWAILQAKYATRLDVPQAEWDELVNQIEQREQMKAEGREVASIGGLHVIGSERHEARRIDLQLRGRCGRQGDPGSSRFYLSLEDDLMRIFAGEWVKNVLTRLGMEEGQAIESRMVSRRIEGAQKKVEERNFEVRKSLLEYDEVMDEQRKRVYGYRQRLLDGDDCRQLIRDMVDAQIDHFFDQFLDKDYGADSFATWAGKLLGVEFTGRDFRGMDLGMAEVHARDRAERMAESQVFEMFEENLPGDESEEEWNWEALAKAANVRWRLGVRDKDLKRAGRENVAQSLIDGAHESIRKVDLSDGDRFLHPDFGLQTACLWAKHKFNVALELDRVRSMEAVAIKQLVRDAAHRAYDEKESEFPVMAGLYHFTVADATGHKRYDKEGLVEWAKTRFGVELSMDDFRNRQRHEIQALLLEHSRRFVELAAPGLRETERRLLETFDRDKVDADGGQRSADAASKVSSLIRWLETEFDCRVPAHATNGMDRRTIQRHVRAALDDKFRPEMARMERSVVLQILDSAWKEHLLVMDHLKASVGFRGYAQVDPKVEYKREGMRLFDAMWNAVGQRVTDLVFRMEQLEADFVQATFKETEAIHEQAPPSSEIADQQQAAIDGTQGSGKSEPVRNRQGRVGRNETCPCGSGKKFKQCHGRRGR